MPSGYLCPLFYFWGAIKYGNSESVKQLYRGIHIILMDDDDYERLKGWTWIVNKAGGSLKECAFRWLKKPNKEYLHRVVIGLYDPEIKVKPRNGNLLDCRKENLIVVRKKEKPLPKPRPTQEEKRLKTNAQHRDYYVRNKDRIKAWRHKPEAMEWRRQYISRRNKTTHYRVRRSVMRRMQEALHDDRKAASTQVLLGCSIKEYREYLQSKFQPDMTWDNYGKLWNIDHIIPCKHFDLSKPEWQMLCFHYSNTQPMLCVENSRKQHRWVG